MTNRWLKMESITNKLLTMSANNDDMYRLCCDLSIEIWMLKHGGWYNSGKSV